MWYRFIPFRGGIIQIDNDIKDILLEICKEVVLMWQFLELQAKNSSSKWTLRFFMGLNVSNSTNTVVVIINNPTLVCSSCITKYFTLDSWNKENGFSCSFGTDRPRLRCQQLRFLLRPLPLVCRWLPSLCVPTWLFSLSPHSRSTSSSCKDTRSIYDPI